MHTHMCVYIYTHIYILVITSNLQLLLILYCLHLGSSFSRKETWFLTTVFLLFLKQGSPSSQVVDLKLGFAKINKKKKSSKINTPHYSLEVDQYIKKVIITETFAATLQTSAYIQRNKN